MLIMVKVLVQYGSIICIVLDLRITCWTAIELLILVILIVHTQKMLV